MNSTDRRPVGLQIKLARIERGLKQYELAQRIGISAPMLSEIENGKREPSADELQALRQALGLEAAA